MKIETHSVEIGLRPSINKEFKKIHFDVPQTIEQLVFWEKNYREKLASRESELKIELEKATADYEVEREAYKQRKQAEEEKERLAQEARQTEIDRLEAEKEAERAAAKKQYEDDRAAWINEKGSEHLKTGLRLGYNINRTYVEERADIEYPDFVVDYKDEYGWRERINPSEAALKEVAALADAGINAKIVWLTDAPNDDEEFENCEAIAIRKYLGRYNLVMIVAEV